MRVGAAAAGRARGSPSGVAVRVAVRRTRDLRARDRVVQEVRRAGDALTLVAVGASLARDAVVRTGTGSACLLDAEGALETELVDDDGLGVEVERACHVNREYSARMKGAVPGSRAEGCAEGRARVLRNPDDLERPEAVRGGDRSGEVVAVDQAAAQGDETYTDARGRDVLVQTGRAERGGSVDCVGSLAIRGSVGRVDVRVLHLDDQEQVSGRDGGRCAGDPGTDRDGGGAGCCAGGGRVVGVDDAGQRRVGSVDTWRNAAVGNRGDQLRRLKHQSGARDQCRDTGHEPRPKFAPLPPAQGGACATGPPRVRCGSVGSDRRFVSRILDRIYWIGNLLRPAAQVGNVTPAGNRSLDVRVLYRIFCTPARRFQVQKRRAGRLLAERPPLSCGHRLVNKREAGLSCSRHPPMWLARGPPGGAVSFSLVQGRNPDLCWT